jgi:predicted RNA-binding Zn-ribbon protein involved in translation (DUF1610 family)
MGDGKAMVCARCGLALEPRKVGLSYLGHALTHEFPACPKCGAVYIPEDFVRERMNDVERKMEDK